MEVGHNILVRGDTHHHMARVLRLQKGQRVRLLDGEGQAYWARVEEVGAGETRLFIEEEDARDRDPGIQIHLFQALPKKDRFEYVLEKGCELGIAAFFPLETKRTIPTVRGKNQGKKMERWRRILRSSAQQCMANRIPYLGEPVTFSQIQSLMASYDSVLVAYEEAPKSLSDVLATKASVPRSIMLIVGPEGSFTAEETQEMQDWGGEFFSLGPRILRSDTAGLMACSILLFYFGALEVST